MVNAEVDAFGNARSELANLLLFAAEEACDGAKHHAELVHVRLLACLHLVGRLAGLDGGLASSGESVVDGDGLVDAPRPKRFTHIGGRVANAAGAKKEAPHALGRVGLRVVRYRGLVSDHELSEEDVQVAFEELTSVVGQPSHRAVLEEAVVVGEELLEACLDFGGGCRAKVVDIEVLRGQAV